MYICYIYFASKLSLLYIHNDYNKIIQIQEIAINQNPYNPKRELL